MPRISTLSFFLQVCSPKVGWDNRTGRTIRGSHPGEEQDLPPSVPTDPGAHPASYIMGTGVLPGVMRMGHFVDPLPSSVEVKERLELYLCSPSGPSGPVLRWPLPLHSLGLTKLMHLFFPRAYHVTQQSHSPLFHDSNDILWTAQII